MQAQKYITFISKRRKIVLKVNTILYVLMIGKNAEIHVSDGNIYEARMTLRELEEELGESFIKVHRGCLVSVRAIYNITDMINLSNGESLGYTIRKKKQIINQFHEKQKKLLTSFAREGIPVTKAEYLDWYSSFENMPFAFTDIEMVFDEKKRAIDWIFRYGNPALAELEKVPLEKLIGNSFGSIFSNMDSKWLRSYEQAALYGEVMEIMDYSPEIDTYLKVICFPTFPGHCGCILFDISNIKFARGSSRDAEKTLALFLNQILKINREES